MVNWEKGKELKNGKFIVEKYLGQGGYGYTYKVIKSRTKETFAVKTLNDLAQDKENFAEIQDDFFNEAIKLACCRHPNIVGVHPQSFREDGIFCMVMEYVEGQNLDEYLEENGQIPESEAIALITRIGKALIEVHEKGLLHRDIKPSNIMLRNGDLSSPVLIDFGLAREFNPNKPMTTDYRKTKEFAPLEQYNLESLSKHLDIDTSKYKVGTWTDIYALAATLYNLLTNQEPIQANYRKASPQSFKPPQELNPQISDRTNKAILKGMEIEPSDRPQKMQDWLDLLNPIKPKEIDITFDFLETILEDDRVPEKDDRVPEKIEFSATKISDTEYEFDVITVNEKGEEINREQRSAKYFTENLGNDVIIDMIKIPGGTFIMGSPGDENRNENECPQHPVTVSSFYMSKFPVTQAQWKQVAAMPQIDRKLDPVPRLITLFRQQKRFSGDELPVEFVSWFDALEFCKRLSKVTDNEYRLPSESEWEYACRAGTTTPFYFGETITTNLVNYRGIDRKLYYRTNINNAYLVYPGNYANEPKGEYREKTTPVGSFPPNPFGLFDMHGNVWEWCEDTYQDNYEGAPNDGSSACIEEKSSKKVTRGGSWLSLPHSCRSAFRTTFDLDNAYRFLGFRVVCISRKKI